MRVLVVAATRLEVAPLLSAMALPVERDRMVSGLFGAHQLDVLLTGVGMVATAVWCARTLATEHYDVALNLGICGSFNPALPPPTIVHVTKDMFSELGVEDGPRFLTLHELGLLEPNAFPFSNGRLENAAPPSLPTLAALPVASGITVNTAHGEEVSIASIVARCAPDVESMEGAAFMYACRVAGVPFAQVRAVSNRVERRNRAGWDLVGAVQRLGRVSRRLLEQA
ncbi:MAG: futalosine hydrolase [Vicinamibacterales bacterium]